MIIRGIHDGAVAARGLYALWFFGEDDEVMVAKIGQCPNMNVARSFTCT